MSNYEQLYTKNGGRVLLYVEKASAKEVEHESEPWFEWLGVGGGGNEEQAETAINKGLGRVLKSYLYGAYMVYPQRMSHWRPDSQKKILRIPTMTRATLKS